MSHTYARSSLQSQAFSSVAWGFLIAAIVFVLLPLLQISTRYLKASAPQAIATLNDQPPPAILDVPPVVVPPKEKEEIQLKEPPKPIDLVGLELLINATTPNGLGVTYGNPTDYIDIGEMAEIFDLDRLDRKPRAIYQIKPNYPYDLKNAGIAGWVEVEWIINAKGSVSGIRILESSHRGFDHSAIEAISRSKWKPGEIANKPVSTRVRQKISFNP